MSNQGKTPDREQIVANLLSWKQWVRILLMILGGLISWVVNFVQVVVAVLQAIFVLITGYDNERLRKAGIVLAMYQAQIWLYLSYASDTKPFPMNDLPADPDDLDLDREEAGFTDEDLSGPEKPAAGFSSGNGFGQDSGEPPMKASDHNPVVEEPGEPGYPDESGQDHYLVSEDDIDKDDDFSDDDEHSPRN